MRRHCGLLLLLVVLTVPARAQTDPSASYRTLHTEHFRVHFRQEHRDAARTVAREAERAYRLLASELEPPRGTVDIALADEFDLSNGFAQVFPSNRLTVHLVPPSSGTLIDHDDWLRIVTVHELTHIFHLDRAGGVWGVLQAVFGRAPGLFPNGYQPSWVTEGIATYYESRFSGAGRVGSSPHRQIIRGERGSGLARRRDDATAVNIRWPRGNAAYAYGAELFAQMERAAGDSAVPQYVASTSGQLIPFSTGRHVKRLTGQPVGEVWEDAHAPFGPLGTDGEADALVASGLLLAPESRVSSSGDHLAYVHDDGYTPRHVRVVAVENWATVARHLVNGGVELAWDGDDVLVTQLDWTGLYQLRSDLYRWQPLSGGAWTRVTRDGRLTAPASGGTLITAIQLTPTQREPVLVGTGGAINPLETPVRGGVWQRVEPSPDGEWFAGIVHHEGSWDVVVWPRDGSSAARWVTEDAAVESFVTWSGPRAVLYASDVTGVPQTYEWSMTTGEYGRLSDAANGTLSPGRVGGDRIAYAVPELGGYRLLVGPTWTRAAVVPEREGAAFAAADEAPARETGYSSWPSLRPHYWLPFGNLNSQAGDFFGLFTSGQDAIQRTTYALAGAVNPGSGRWIGFFSLTDLRLGRPVLDLFADQSWSSTLALVDSVPTTVLVREREVEAGATFTRKRWRWLMSARVSGGWEQDHFSGFLSRNFLTGSVVLLVARSVTPSLAISRERGFEVLARFRRREHLGSGGYSNEVRLRAGFFLPTLGRRHVLAVKAAYGRTGGDFAKILEIGGASGGGIDPVPGITLSTRRSFPVRGYPSDLLFGTRAFSGTVEYRMPLVYVGRGIKPFPLGVTRLSAALFTDVGGAWFEGESQGLTDAVAIGAELVGDIIYGFDIPLRVRFGLGVPVKDVSGTRIVDGTSTLVRLVSAGEARLYLSIGSDF